MYNNPIQNVKLYLSKFSKPLFKTLPDNNLKACFDDKGFFLSDFAQAHYNIIKNEPHLYIAFINDIYGTTYIGKSNQKGGRWKRSHAYHLGTLAHHINNTIRYDDQNHNHWIDAWMNRNEIQINELCKTITLKSEVLVAFIPFNIYSANNFQILTKNEINAINHSTESLLIKHFLNLNVGLLNVQGINNI